MKVKLKYEELSTVLGYVNTILSDKTVDDKMKNVIFLVKDGEATVVGYSPLTFSRTSLDFAETEGVDEDWEFQLKSSELNKIIASYSNLFKTKVDYVEFEKSNNKIKMIIHEEAINEEDARLAQTGRFMIDNVPILDITKKEIHMDFPEESDSVITSELLIYIDSLFPLMSNDSGNSLSSKLNFGDDYVFMVSSSSSTFFDNKLPDAFKGLTLGYSSVNFLKRLCEGSESIFVHKLDKYICIQSGLTEAFMKYQKVRVNTSHYLRGMSTDNGIVIDRLYFKDVLKRMMVSSQDGMVQMMEDGLEVSNSDFNQLLPINNKKGDVDNLKFKISVPLLSKSVVGDDSLLPGEIFLYFVKSGPRGYILYVKDSTNSWMSTLQVRV